MTDHAPEWAFERAEVRPHDPSWSLRAQAESAELTKLLTPWLEAEVEHVGSTAVPGLAAKPIIDLMASVADLDIVVDQANLSTRGWRYVPPELDQRPWRRFFVKPDATGRHREAHLHLIQRGHHRWTDQIRFRDALRSDETLARAYEELKRHLATSTGHDREAYTEGKAAFVAKVLKAF
ncbi:GrpB family protein [Lentzea sp. NPDC051838]|uniref:GrpB family protein n=1 Tax=Lentzea sp. NPDC051838 TaxID=3154849 RepID=UPI00343E8416